MNQTQQAEKKQQQVQQQYAKQQLQRKKDALVIKQLIADEWKAEVDIMKYTLEYEDLLPKYTELRLKRESEGVDNNEESFKIEETDADTKIEEGTEGGV